MTGPEHYRAAEQLLGQVVRKGTIGPIVAEGTDVPDIIAAAHAHATLALAAATALGVGGDNPPDDAEAWWRVAGTRDPHLGRPEDGDDE